MCVRQLMGGGFPTIDLSFPIFTRDGLRFGIAAGRVRVFFQRAENHSHGSIAGTICFARGRPLTTGDFQLQNERISFKERRNSPQVCQHQHEGVRLIINNVTFLFQLEATVV